MDFDKADLIMLELSMAKDDTELFEESGAYDIIKTISSKIQKLIIKMTSWLKKIRVDIDVMVMEHEKNQRFKDLENLIKNDPKGKKKKIYFCNVEGAVELYQKYIKKFQKNLKSIMRKSFASYSEKDSRNLNYQITTFEADLEEFDQLVSSTLDEKIVMVGQEALDYIKSCKKGIEPVYKYYFNLIRSYEQFKVEAEKELLYKIIDTNNEVRANVYKAQNLMAKVSTKASSVARKVLYKVVWWTA